MFGWFWRMVASWACSERGFEWLKHMSVNDPYKHILGTGGKLYMGRWWVLKRRFNLPSIRLHRIMVADSARDLHSHPFNFRTIILRGWYIQEVPGKHWPRQLIDTRTMKMRQGMTAVCSYGDYHRITQVSKGGCWTLFIAWGGKRDDWGFMTKNGYVNFKDYIQAGNYA